MIFNNDVCTYIYFNLFISIYSNYTINNGITLIYPKEFKKFSRQSEQPFHMHNSFSNINCIHIITNSYFILLSRISFFFQPLFFLLTHLRLIGRLLLFGGGK